MQPTLSQYPTSQVLVRVHALHESDIVTCQWAIIDLSVMSKHITRVKAVVETMVSLSLYFWDVRFELPGVEFLHDLDIEDADQLDEDMVDREWWFINRLDMDDFESGMRIDTPLLVVDEKNFYFRCKAKHSNSVWETKWLPLRIVSEFMMELYKNEDL